MSELTLSAESVFDSLQRPDGTWSARDLMPHLGYGADWRNFESAIDRARLTAENQGLAFHDLFVGVTEKSGGRPRFDYSMSRFACYLVAMNGDPRKPEVASAQSYFAIKTREAETSAPAALTLAERLAIGMEAMQELVATKDEQIAVLAPKAEFFDELMDAEGMYSMQAVAKMLGFGPNILFREARRAGILQGNNLPYQRYEHHFKVIPGTYKNRKTGDTVPTATTKVRPSGVDFLRKKLAGALV